MRPLGPKIELSSVSASICSIRSAISLSCRRGAVTKTRPLKSSIVKLTFCSCPGAAWYTICNASTAVVGSTLSSVKICSSGTCVPRLRRSSIRLSTAATSGVRPFKISEFVCASATICTSISSPPAVGLPRPRNRRKKLRKFPPPPPAMISLSVSAISTASASSSVMMWIRSPSPDWSSIVISSCASAWYSGGPKTTLFFFNDTATTEICATCCRPPAARSCTFAWSSASTEGWTCSALAFSSA